MTQKKKKKKVSYCDIEVQIPSIIHILLCLFLFLWLALKHTDRVETIYPFTLYSIDLLIVSPRCYSPSNLRCAPHVSDAHAVVFVVISNLVSRNSPNLPYDTRYETLLTPLLLLIFLTSIFPTFPQSSTCVPPQG